VLHALGLEVTGSDAPAAVVANAVKNLADPGVDVPLHRAD
jgi:hypothetical protein